MDSPIPSSMRVLTRPPGLTLSSDPPPQLPPSSTSNSLHHSPNGVVVVGFISQRPDTSSQLINRVLDSNIFGSGRMDKRLNNIDKEEVKRWFESRRISYYHEEEKGLLFLQFCSTCCPVLNKSSESGSRFDSVFEEHEFGDLQGLLFMFFVCHVIIYIQEGSRFDTQILKKFRVLQAAKNALRTRSTPPLPSRPHSSSPSQPSVLVTSSSSSSLGRSGGISGRNASAISLMSGLGSYASLLPGQCTPVTLFVFIDDFSDMPNPNTIVEESTEATSLSQSSSLTSLSRPALPMKGSGSVVVLARPSSKSEGSFRKKLQSSLEAHIRFLIKKCRTLSGSESSHARTRAGGVLSSAPLFSLDASRAVVLLDRITNQSGESLEFAISLVEDVLNGVATSDSLLLESHSQNASKEDILLIKEFIYRQSDIIRGRGGGLVTNANSSSAAGVGMVAVAAAAAAASAASGKTLSTPELPSFDIWLSSSQLILQGVLSAKHGFVDETELSKIKPHQKNTVPLQVEVIASRGKDPLDIAISLLESGGGLNTKFSTLWCERSLPAAKNVYLKGLPACYPTSQHESHLEKALHAFQSMVRGPAVPLYAKLLEDECKSTWESGRQLCDAVSLTGKPCMHQRHSVGYDESIIGTAVKPHSSGYVFLHACACGRSRRLRSDPFDFESANKTSCFSDCDELLPKIELPDVSPAGPVDSSSWSLIRVGGARYYEPSNGLLQSGFSVSHKFLLKWTIFLEKQKTPNDLPVRALQQGSVVQSSAEPKNELNTDMDIKKLDDTQLYTGDMNKIENQRKPAENCNSHSNKISFGRGLPNFTMRKPFSEVVAGTAPTDAKFPPLEQRKQLSAGLEKGIKENMARDRSVERVHASVDQGSKKSEDVTSVQETINKTNSSGRDGEPFLRIGSNVVPVNISGAEKVKLNPTMKHVIVYVGFEHECPRGHRFLLTPGHLNELGSSYSLLEESHTHSSADTLDHSVANSSKLGKNGSHGKVHRMANGVTTATAVNKVRGVSNSKEIVLNGNLHKDGLIQISRPGKEPNQPNHVKDLEAGLQSISLGDGGCAFSMLNRNLPVYMNCPHCRTTKNKKDPPKIKFASSISQLQRIFLVTPPFPIVLATCPNIQFEASCLPPSVPDREQKLQFSLGCRVILPPQSFLALRLPFVYGVQLEDGSLQSLKPFERETEKTAWITKGSVLQVMSKGSCSQTY